MTPATTSTRSFRATSGWAGSLLSTRIFFDSRPLKTSVRKRTLSVAVAPALISMAESAAS